MHVRGDQWYGKQNEGGLGAKERRDKFSLSFLFFTFFFFLVELTRIFIFLSLRMLWF